MNDDESLDEAVDVRVSCLILKMLTILLLIIITTHNDDIVVDIEDSYKIGVLAHNFDKPTSFLVGSFGRRLVFGANSGCNGCSMTRGLQCTRFEVRTVITSEDMYNLIYQRGVHCGNDIQQFMSTL